MSDTLVPTQAELAEQVAREFVIRVYDHLGKGRTGQVSLWSHVYPQFKDELREIANDVANTVVRTRPLTLPDDRDAVLPWATLRDIVTPPPFWHNEAAWTVMARLVVAALSKHDRNERADDGQG